jgi:GNAT superfamily N-acetyltransferase
MSSGFKVFEIGGGKKPAEAVRLLPEALALYREAELRSLGNAIWTHAGFLADGNTVVAAIHGYVRDNNLKVSRFAVAEGMRGQGLGRSMLAHVAASWIDDSGTVSLEPRPSSIPFYERVGLQFDPGRSYETGVAPVAIWSAPAATIIASVDMRVELPPSLSS